MPADRARPVRETSGRSRPSEVAHGSEPAFPLLERLRVGDAPFAAPSACVVVAHPDDEVIGAGGQLPRLKDVFVLHVTDGAPRDMRDATAAGFATRESYGPARRRELERALSLAGISPDQTAELGVADQEASLHLAELARQLAEHLARNRRPEVIVTLPYEGGHPDHDATAFAVHAACQLLGRHGLAPPAVVEMTSYHNCDGAMAAFTFLPGDPDDRTVTLPLSGPQRNRKRRMIDCFATQKAVLAPFPIELERLRPAPAYDFTRPAHEGRLFYEFFDWGMSGERWRALAAEALASLDIGGSAP